MKGSDFIFDCVHLLCYKCHKINLNCNKSYVDSPDWIKITKATINLINGDDKSLQYAVTSTLNYEEIKKVSQRISKTRNELPMRKR